MQKSPMTDKEAKREAMSKQGIVRWGCPCCGPRDSKEHQAIHQHERTVRDRQEEEWGDED